MSKNWIKLLGLTKGGYPAKREPGAPGGYMPKARRDFGCVLVGLGI